MGDTSGLGGIQQPPGGQWDISQYQENWEGNWSGHDQIPGQTPGVKGETGFAVVQPDGTFDSRYPIQPVQGQPWSYGAVAGSSALAVGGWTNSEPSGGLYQVLQPPSPPTSSGISPAAENLIKTIVAHVGSNSPSGENYQTVTLDYEAFGATSPAQVATVNAFVQQLSGALGNMSPPVKLEMAISPVQANQQYFTLSDVAKYVSAFQVMSYDYGRGVSAPMTVVDNSSISQTTSYISSMLSQGVQQSQISVGVPFYGLQYQIDPTKYPTPEAVQAALKDGSLQSSGYVAKTGSGDGTITDDDLLYGSKANPSGGTTQDQPGIKDWNNPSPPWQLMTDGETPPGQYYYNTQTNVLVSAMNPTAIQDLAQAVKQNFPDVNQVFCYGGYGDEKANVINNVMQAFNS